MDVLIFESDWTLAQTWCQAVLCRNNVFVLSTEHALNRFLGQFRDTIDLAIINLMGRWDNDGELVPCPDDVADGGVENAGFRCADYIRGHSPNAKIIIFAFFDGEGVLSRAGSVADAVVRSTRPEVMAEAVAKVLGRS